MASKPPQLDRVELQQLRWLFGAALVLLAAWTVPYMDIDAWFWLALITLVAPVMLWRPALAARLPRWAHRLAFPLFLLLTAADWRMDTLRILPALVRLTLMLLLYRVATVRQRREDLQVIVLGLFLVVVTGVLSVSVMFVVQILAFTVCALLLLLTLTLADAAGPAPALADWTQVSWPALLRRVRAVTNWKVVLAGSGLFVALVAVSSVFFIFLPRFDLEGTLFFDHLMQGKTRTGFTDEVKLGDITDIKADDSIAFHVDVDDRSKLPALRYWRMTVLDAYGAGNFQMSWALQTRLKEGLKESTTQYRGGETPRAGAPVWTFYFEPGISRYLALPGGFSQLDFTEAQSVDGERELRIVRLAHSPVQMLAYKVEGLQMGPTLAASILDLVGNAKDGATPAESDVALAAFTVNAEASRKDGTTPAYSDLHRIKAAADQAKLVGWVRALGAPPDNPEEFGRLAREWLRTNHQYSFTVPAAKGPGDPVVEWMSGRDGGHCEYFAAATILLARTAGYPARMAVGFRGGIWNAISGNFTVRNSDAHAWCELLDRAKQEWIRVDPTPPEGNAPFSDVVGAAGGLANLERISDHTFSARFDSLRMFWYRRIVDFNQGSQVALAQRTKQAVEELGHRLKAWLKAKLLALGAWAARPWDLRRIALVAGGAGVLLGLAWVLRAARQVWGRRHDGHPVRRLAGRWLVRLGAWVETPEGAELGGELRRLRYGAAKSWPNPAKIFRASRHFWRRRSS